MDALTIEQARALAKIFAKVKCRDVLAMEVSWVWPEHSWSEMVADALAELATKDETP